jgi:hypothetical protein
MKRFIAFYLMTAVVLLSVQICPAQTSPSDWNSLGSYLDREIAVKTKSGTTFGILRAADGNEIKIQTAERKASLYTHAIFSRGEVRQIWTAELRSGNRRTLKGALTGAGLGAGIGLVSAATEKEDGQAGVAVPVLALYGAAIGGFIGFFVRAKHRKSKLIYSS